MNLYIHHISKIQIETFDNSGWGITVSLPLTVETDRKSILHERSSEEDWIFLFEETGQVRAGGDEQKLVRMIQLIANYFRIPKHSPQLVETLPLITYIQTWYTFECDGFWEHLYGVQGEINSDGKCRFVIDLDETYWEEEPFETVGSISTFQCRKEGAKFIGEGQFEHALFYLKTFKEWIESFNIEVLHTYDGKLYIPRNEL